MNTAACKYVLVFSIDYAYIKFSGCFCVWVLPLCCGIVDDVIMTLFLESSVKIFLFFNCAIRSTKYDEHFHVFFVNITLMVFVALVFALSRVAYMSGCSGGFG